jgi:hypothetical protein
MTDTPPDWVLIEAAKRSGEILTKDNVWPRHAAMFPTAFRALCDMIQKYEQPPVDRKLLCAREAMARNVHTREGNDYRSGLMDEGLGVQDCLRAIELWEEGFGK